MRPVRMKSVLALCLCLLLLSGMIPAGADSAWLRGPGTWKGYAFDTIMGDPVFYAVQITMNEDGSGELTLTWEDTEMTYAMRNACPDPFDGYSVSRPDDPDDPLDGISSRFTDDTVWLGYHGYVDAEHPGWLTADQIVLLPMSAWEKPYADASEGYAYAAEDVTIYPVGMSADEELLRAEWNEYDPKSRSLLIRFVLDQPKGTFAIQNYIAQYIYLRGSDGYMRKCRAIVWPGGRDSDRTYSTFDLVFYGGIDPDALVCFDTAFSLDTLGEITEVFTADMTDRGQIERLWTRMKNGGVPALEGTPQVGGKLAVVTVHSTGQIVISSVEAGHCRQLGWTDYYGIPFDMLAEKVEEADTIVFVTERHRQTGTYTGGGLALKTYTEMTVVDPAQDAAYGTIVVAEDDPPQTAEMVPGQKSAAGLFRIRDAMEKILELASAP